MVPAAFLPPAAAREWADVLAALPTNAALSETTSTALGLWLVREVYGTPRHDPAPLLGFEDGQSLRTHLYEHLIPAVVNARPPSTDPAEPFVPRRRHEPERIRTWLTTLAALLEHDETTRPRHRVVAPRRPLPRAERVVRRCRGRDIGRDHRHRRSRALRPSLAPRRVSGSRPGCGSRALAGGERLGWHSPGYADFRIRGRVEGVASTTVVGDAAHFSAL